jgi:hypothetical protein
VIVADDTVVVAGGVVTVDAGVVGSVGFKSELFSALLLLLFGGVLAGWAAHAIAANVTSARSESLVTDRR